MTKIQLPPVLRRWRFVAAVVSVTALAGGGVLLAANNSDPATALAFHTVPTVRVLDTRPLTQVGTRGTPLGLGDTLDLVIPGLPDDATAVNLNVTVVDGTEGSFLTVYPTGDARPIASTINWDAAGAVANTALVDLHDDHSITMYNLKGTVNVVIDLLGYYAETPVSSGTTATAQHFYATNNSTDLLPALASLQFGTAGPATAGITSVVPRNVFTVASAGVYSVTFSLTATNDNQFTIVVNDGSVATDLTFGAVAGRNGGSALLTLAAGDTFTLRNTGAAAVQLSGPTGGSNPSINASIVIELL